MTLEAMQAFGIQVEPIEFGWRIPGSQCYCARSFSVEGDWSQAAFFLAAGALGGTLAVEGLKPNSTQGDRDAA